MFNCDICIAPIDPRFARPTSPVNGRRLFFLDASIFSRLRGKYLSAAKGMGGNL